MDDHAGPPFASFAEALEGPRSAFFGTGPDGKGKRPESHYRSVDRYVRFDVSNNQILCSIAANGLLENACVLKDVVPSRGIFDRLPGVLAEKELIGGGPWPLSVQIDGHEPTGLHETPLPAVELLGNILPVFEYRHDPLRIRLLAFAPVDAQAAAASPRAIVLILHLCNESDGPVHGVLRTPAGVPDLSGARDPMLREAAICLDGGAWQPRWPAVGFTLGASESAVFSFGFLLGESVGELRRTACALRAREALDWLNQTWEYHADRLGRLSIPDDPYYAESLVRFRELCRQSVLRRNDGRFGAGFWGSDFIGVSAWASPKIWNKDNFHAMLPMALLEPALCRDAILFFLRWSLPHAPYGPAARRFTRPRRITHSLANGLSPLILAGAYYQMTGDKTFFRAHREVLHLGRDLLDDVLQSRQAEPFLFPSMYLSDGEARGDYHTGSNLLVWYAFHHLARLASEVYGESELASQWSEAAARVEAALRERCTGSCSLGARFLEGANEDGTFVDCHDGEETDVALMPFYGFCDADDPALINHSRLALSPANPLYAPGIDGIWWDETTRPAATFPGWMTGLAGAVTEEEVHLRLEQIRRLTDLDGSIWWWPYRYGETDPARVRRRDPYFALDVRGEQQQVGVGKCGWAAGVYLCLFVHNLLGLRVDVPARQVSLRPFCPWSEFRWTDCRLGDSRFDFAYKRGGDRAVGRITNRNEHAVEGVIELTLPEGAEATACTCNGARADSVELARRYGRSSLRVARAVAAGEALEFAVEYTTA